MSIVISRNDHRGIEGSARTRSRSVPFCCGLSCSKTSPACTKLAESGPVPRRTGSCTTPQKWRSLARLVEVVRAATISCFDSHIISGVIESAEGL
jgi:hypothetical protein